MWGRLHVNQKKNRNLLYYCDFPENHMTDPLPWGDRRRPAKNVKTGKCRRNGVGRNHAVIRTRVYSMMLLYIIAQC